MFEKTILVNDKPYTLQFDLWTPEMKKIYNSGKGENYNNIVPV
jgi:hypothetical protein